MSNTDSKFEFPNYAEVIAKINDKVDKNFELLKAQIEDIHNAMKTLNQNQLNLNTSISNLNQNIKNNKLVN